MTKKIIIANWKMNNSFDELQLWLEIINKKISLYKKDLADLVLCPPLILLDYADELLMEKELEELEKLHKNIDDMDEDELEELTFKARKINLGGQNCHHEISGAYTGEVSAKMLKDAGCKYVILGHSERRTHNFESDEIISGKVKAALSQKLIPILCVGESKELRAKKSHFDFIEKQILSSLANNGVIKDIVIAYEPIWSIGTGSLPTTSEIEEMAEFIKNIISKNQQLKIKNFRIVYGGSVNKSNAGEILKSANIDGLLVGGSSLVAEEFFEIAKLA